MKKVLPWTLLWAALLAAIPIASQFTPDQVVDKLSTWRTVAVVVIAVLLIISLIRMARAYFRPPAADAISQHDVQLFARINEVLNDGALTFLADHDFHNDCHVSNLKPVETISYWHGPNYMFNDRAIQKRWEKLFAKILHLSSTHGSNLINSEDNVERMTAWHLGFPKNAQPPQAHVEVKELNDAALDVYRGYGEFAPFARKRLRL
ncbi:hypothetical protein [Allosphingosinicella humi]